MASYALDSSPAPETKQADSKKITFRFCRECSNMLYPKADPSGDSLFFSCRTCTFTEPATASCIYRNSLKEDVAETPGNVEDVAQDPTVGDSDPSDSAMEGVELASQGPIVPYMCTLCGQEILCPTCGQPSDASVALEVDDPEAEVDQKGQGVVEAEKRERALSGTPRFSSF